MALSVFISAAAEDQAAVNDLCKYLQPGVAAGQVQLWHQSLLPGGARISEVRAQHLQRARLIVVILSADWRKEPLLVDEVSAALQRKVKVLPIRYRPVGRLQGTGLHDVQALPRSGAHLAGRSDAEDQWVLIADEILETQAPVTAETTVGDVLHAALHLDRQPQWLQILAEHKAGGSVLFLLHGHWKQRLDFFARRLHSHLLRNLPGESHELITLRLPEEEPRPRSAAQWALLLRDELQHRGTHGAALPELLAIAASERPLFVLVGGKPLDEELLTGCEEGLRAFLAHDLPLAVAQARPRHPVRALLCAQHLGDPAFTQRMQALVMTPGLRFCPLPELTLPQREDVHDYLKAIDPPLSAAKRQVVLEAYDSLSRRGEIQTFSDLVQLLERHLL